MIQDLEFRIAKLEVRPGDVLVAKCEGHLSREQAINFRKLLESVLPAGVRALVLDGGTSLEVLSAAEIARRSRETLWSSP